MTMRYSPTPYSQEDSDDNLAVALWLYSIETVCLCLWRRDPLLSRNSVSKHSYNRVPLSLSSCLCLFVQIEALVAEKKRMQEILDKETREDAQRDLDMVHGQVGEISSERCLLSLIRFP